MDIDCREVFWDLFEKFGGVDAYICYSAYKNVAASTNITDTGFFYEHL